MSREIKFRAWNSIDKCMCDNATTLTSLRGFIKSKHYHPMQYTGLKDIDGCEICESDVCEIMYYTPFGDKTNEFYGNWVVKKWMGMFVLVSEKERLSFTDFANVTKTEYAPNLGTVAEFSDKVNVRVIGNIHEHKHLIDNN